MKTIWRFCFLAAVLQGIATSQTIVVNPTELQLATTSCEAASATGSILVSGAFQSNVEFQVTIATNTGGSGWLSTDISSGVTPARLHVTARAVMLTSSEGRGTITLTPTAPQGDPVEIQVQFRPQRPATFPLPPEVRGVVSSANFKPPLAPGMIASAFGTNLGSVGPVSFMEGVEPKRLPTETCGFQIVVNGRPSPLFFISESQVNFQIPFETELGSSQIVVLRGDEQSEPLLVIVERTAPSIYSWPTGDSVTDPIWINVGGLGPGGAIVLPVTGLGPLAPPIPTGQLTPISPLSWSSADLSATIDGVPAPILFQGFSPSWVGLGQVNVLIPEGVGMSNRIFELRSGGRLVALFEF